jgi:hypothetical protein
MALDAAVAFAILALSRRRATSAFSGDAGVTGAAEGTREREGDAGGRREDAGFGIVGGLRERKL